MKIGHPKGMKTKMRTRELKCGVHWPVALKRKGVKQVGVKQELGVQGFLIQ